MRILHVIPGVAPRYGGPSVAVIGMGRALAARGVAVMIATTDADGDQRLPVSCGVETEYSGVPAVFFPRHGEGFKYSPELARWLSKSVGAFDLVHIHAVFSHSSLAAARACRAAGTPYVVRPLGSLDPWSLRQKRLQKRALLWAGVRSMLGHAAAIHYTTNAERRLAEMSVGRLPSIVVPLGIDEPDLDPLEDSSSRSPVVVALTRLHPKKNLDVLIRAFLDVRDEIPGWQLVIAGSGDPSYETALRDLVRARRAVHEVEFAGWLDRDAKRRLLARAEVFALPSHTENFGLGLLEAMAAGLAPVVARAVNLSEEIEQASAGWVSDDGELPFRRALQEALSDATERRIRAARARALARRFTWTAAAESLEAAYRSAIERRHDPASGAAAAWAAAGRRD